MSNIKNPQSSKTPTTGAFGTSAKQGADSRINLKYQATATNLETRRVDEYGDEGVLCAATNNGQNTFYSLHR